VVVLPIVLESDEHVRWPDAIEGRGKQAHGHFVVATEEAAGQAAERQAFSRDAHRGGGGASFGSTKGGHLSRLDQAPVGADAVGKDKDVDFDAAGSEERKRAAGADGLVICVGGDGEHRAGDGIEMEGARAEAEDALADLRGEEPDRIAAHVRQLPSGARPS
jgi:hypothetical protein